MKTIDFKNDLKDGRLVYYYADGTAYRVAHYKEGKLLEPAVLITGRDGVHYPGA